MTMSPKYLRMLANTTDPTAQWKKSPFAQFTKMQRIALDTGVALRRYASHIEALNVALEQGRSLLITPMAKNASSAARAMVRTPIAHSLYLRASPGKPRRVTRRKG